VEKRYKGAIGTGTGLIVNKLEARLSKAVHFPRDILHVKGDMVDSLAFFSDEL
jgi:hypothetical protein